MVRPIVMHVVNRQPKKVTQKPKQVIKVEIEDKRKSGAGKQPLVTKVNQKPKQVIQVKIEDKRKSGTGKQPLVTKVTTKPKGILKKPKIQVTVVESPKKKKTIGFGPGINFGPKRQLEKRRRRFGPQVDFFPSNQAGEFDWKRKAKNDMQQREARQAALYLIKHMDDDEHSVPIKKLKGFRGVQLGGREIENLSDLLRRDAPPSQASSQGSGKLIWPGFVLPK